MEFSYDNICKVHLTEDEIIFTTKGECFYQPCNDSILEINSLVGKSNFLRKRFKVPNPFCGKSTYIGKVGDFEISTRKNGLFWYIMPVIQSDRKTILEAKNIWDEIISMKDVIKFIILTRKENFDYISIAFKSKKDMKISKYQQKLRRYRSSEGF